MATVCKDKALKLLDIYSLIQSKMAGFDETGAYAPQEDVFFDDGREIELLHYVYSRPNVNQLRGSPSDVLEAIDQFARTRKYLMNVGSTKGSIITKLIAETKPPIMVYGNSIN